MEETIGVAVLGCGYWGPNLIRNFRAIDECHVRLVCDIEPRRLVHMRELYPECQTTVSATDAFEREDIQAIAVATPPQTHFDFARRSLLAGKHTFVEKPLALSTTECEELLSLAAKQKLTLMVGHTFIYCSAVRKMKEIVESGELGEILHISSRRLNLGLFQTHINVAWDLAPHDLSIILYLMDHAPRTVNCQGKAHVTPGIEDVTTMTLDFENGALALVHSSWLDPKKVREMTVVGTRKMIVYDDTEPLEKLKIYDKHVDVPPHYDTFAEFQYSYHYGDMCSPYLRQIEPLRTQSEHFLRCIREGKTPDSSGLDGLKVVQILEAAERSLKDGGAKIEIGDRDGGVRSDAPGKSRKAEHTAGG